MNETDYVGRRMEQIEAKSKCVSDAKEVLVGNSATAYEMIRNDLKIAWKSAVRALNAAENSGANDTACEIKDIIICLSKSLEFCESMASA